MGDQHKHLRQLVEAREGTRGCMGDFHALAGTRPTLPGLTEDVDELDEASEAVSKAAGIAKAADKINAMVGRPHRLSKKDYTKVRKLIGTVLGLAADVMDAVGLETEARPIANAALKAAHGMAEARTGDIHKMGLRGASVASDFPGEKRIGQGAGMHVSDMRGDAHALRQVLAQGNDELARAKLGQVLGGLGVLMKNVGLEAASVPVRKVAMKLWHAHGKGQRQPNWIGASVEPGDNELDEDEIKKRMLPHMWVISKDAAGGYLITLGDPKKPGTKIKHRFSGKSAKHDIKDWVKYNVGKKVSADHVLDVSGLKLVPAHYSDFYRKMKLGEGLDESKVPRVIKSVEANYSPRHGLSIYLSGKLQRRSGWGVGTPIKTAQVKNEAEAKKTVDAFLQGLAQKGYEVPTHKGILQYSMMRAEDVDELDEAKWTEVKVGKREYRHNNASEARHLKVQWKIPRGPKKGTWSDVKNQGTISYFRGEVIKGYPKSPMPKHMKEETELAEYTPGAFEKKVAKHVWSKVAEGRKKLKIGPYTVESLRTGGVRLVGDGRPPKVHDIRSLADMEQKAHKLAMYLNRDLSPAKKEDVELSEAQIGAPITQHEVKVGLVVGRSSVHNPHLGKAPSYKVIKINPARTLVTIMMRPEEMSGAVTRGHKPVRHKWDGEAFVAGGKKSPAKLVHPDPHYYDESAPEQPMLSEEMRRYRILCGLDPLPQRLVEGS
jgi:hypothetical protein